MDKYSHIFFDLDHTLWDFDRNSSEALDELLQHFALENLGITDRKRFVAVYHKFNRHYWSLYNHKLISQQELREKRFTETFREFGIPEEKVPAEFHSEYLRLCPTKPYLMDYALEILQYLSAKYHLHILSNGFREVQYVKIRSAGIEGFFRYIVTSELSGYRKPETGIFQFGLQLTGAQAQETIMIGDDFEADILGAKAAGMDQVFFNPAKENRVGATYTIHSLKELEAIL